MDILQDLTFFHLTVAIFLPLIGFFMIFLPLNKKNK